MTNSALPSNITISDAVLFQNMGDKYVLLHTQTEQYFELDEIASRFWQLFSEGLTPSSALEQVMAEYEVTKETLEKDLMTLLQKLQKEQLLTFI